MQNENADEALQRRLQEILTRPDLPAFSEHIQKILYSSIDDSVSVRSITGVVLREYSVALKVLRTANSPIYNRSGRPILSVSHAASLLGMQAIREIAAGMMLFEHFRARPAGVRELMMLSLLTANHARGTALALGFPRAEEAYLCGMFRNLGEVLIACYLPKEYAQILVERKQHNLSGRYACRKVLHFHYEDLGRVMAEHWGMPDSVMECLRESARGSTRLHAQHRDFLNSVVTFSHGLTDAVYRADATASSQVKVDQLRDAFQPALGISAGQLEKILVKSIAEMGETSHTLRIPVDALRLKNQVETALAIVLCIPAAEQEEADATSFITSQVKSGTFDLNDVLLTILEMIYRAGSFDRALFALADPGAQRIQGRLAVGTNSDPLINSFDFPLSIRGGPISVSILRRSDLFRFGHPPETSDPFSEKLGSINFALLPVSADGLVVGCIFCDRTDPRLPSAEEITKIQALRDIAATAIRKRRSRP